MSLGVDPGPFPYQLHSFVIEFFQCGLWNVEITEQALDFGQGYSSNGPHFQ